MRQNFNYRDLPQTKSWNTPTIYNGWKQVTKHVEMYLARMIFQALVVFALLGMVTVAHAYEAPKVKHIANHNSLVAAFIGNSFFFYNNGLHNHVGGLMYAAGLKKRFGGSLVTISGSGFNNHNVEDYFRPNGLSPYSYVNGKKVSYKKGDKLFDLAIMMDCSSCTVDPEKKVIFEEYARKHCDTVRKHGAEPILFMTWAYANAPEMTEQIADAYVKVGNTNNVMVIPAGLAFAKSISIRPDLKLHNRDKKHPSLMGSYLAANVVYASLLGKSSVGNRYTAGLDLAVAKHLQTVAWDTVKDFYQHP